MKNLPVTSKDQSLENYQDVVYQVVSENGKEDPVDFYRYLSLLKRKKWIIIAPIIFILPIMAMNIYIQKKQYESYATLLIEDVNPKVLTNIQDVINVDRSEDFLTTQFEIIKSRAVAEEVVGILNLYETPIKEDDEIVKKIKFILGSHSILLNKFKAVIMQLFDYVSRISETKIIISEKDNINSIDNNRQLIIDQFQNTLVVRPREGTKLVDVGVRSESPQDAAKQANVVVQVYIRQNLEKKLDVARKAVVWLGKEEATLRERVHNAELALQDFRERNKLVSLDYEERQNIVLQNLSNLNSNYMEVKKARLESQAKITNMNRFFIKDIKEIENNPDILNNDLIKNLRSKYLELKYEKANLEKNFTEKHPRILLVNSQIQETKNQIDTEIRNIISSVQISLNTLVEKENSLSSMLNQQKKEVLDLKNNLITFNSLKNELEITKELYLTVAKRLREAKLTEALESNNVKIVQQALPQSVPVSSRSALKIILGIIAGLGLGAGIAFVSDCLDRRFKSAGDIERALGIPLLGVIPHYKLRKYRKGQLITLLEPWSAASEAYRSIRTWIQLSAPKALQTLLITSAVPHEGKSTTSANLAVAYAQLGRKVLLIDADLRRPTIHRIFNLGNRIGLTDILTGKARWEQTIQNTQIENLKVLLAGPTLPNPAEILSTGRVGELLHILKGAFDTIICDSPVQLSIPDVAIIAPDMDGVLLVHRPSRVNKAEVLETKKLLERAGANIVGIVLNNVNKKDQQHYYSYYYEYSYGSFHKQIAESATIQSPYFSTSENSKFITERSNRFLSTDNLPISKINRTSKSHNISITIHEIYFLTNFDNNLSSKEALLAVYVSIHNAYNTDYLFSSELTALHVTDRKYYEMIYTYFMEMQSVNYEDIASYNNNKICNIDSSTSHFENGLKNEQYIKLKDSKNGILVYRVPKEAEYYVFTYINGETCIMIPFNGFIEKSN